MIRCQVCGNELESAPATCPYCETQLQKQTESRNSGYRDKTINLEIGRPFVENALAKLQKNIEIARMEGICILTVIHGYGSSGKGGKIRVESRKLLDFLVEKGDVQSYITGEEFSRKAGPVKMLLRRYPQLGQHPYLNKKNPGMSIVIL